MKLVCLLFLVSCTANKSLTVQKQLLDRFSFASHFVGSPNDNYKGETNFFRYIVHYNIKQETKHSDYQMHFIALSKNLEQVVIKRELKKNAGYEYFEFLRGKEEVFTYRIEIRNKTDQIVDEYQHPHWVSVIQLD